jgi:hypothetical protein
MLLGAIERSKDFVVIYIKNTECDEDWGINMMFPVVDEKVHANLVFHLESLIQQGVRFVSD